MTPLAHYLTRQTLARPKDRAGGWEVPENAELLRNALADVHCFEVTAGIPLIEELNCAVATPGQREDMCGATSFLPAPKTWIEWSPGPGARVALLLQQAAGGLATVTFFARDHTTNLGFIELRTNRAGVMRSARLPDWWVRGVGGVPEHAARGLVLHSHYFLAIINSPKVVTRQQHEPHKGLVREARERLPFALLPWHEIKLQIAKPRDIDDGEAHAAQITGHRALHFVRKFIRVRLGRLEYVRAHWRGDPALGIHQTDYRVSA